jgi:hypothetical protein
VEWQFSSYPADVEGNQQTYLVAERDPRDLNADVLFFTPNENVCNSLFFCPLSASVFFAKNETDISYPFSSNTD